MSSSTATLAWLLYGWVGLVAMTLASHARGREFDPRPQYFFMCLGFFATPVVVSGGQKDHVNHGSRFETGPAETVQYHDQSTAGLLLRRQGLMTF